MSPVSLFLISFSKIL